MRENKNNTRTLGSQYEKKAAAFLKEQGYQILQMNYRCKLGEIDIVCRDREYLAFVEVKYRSTARQGEAVFAVDYKKQRKLSRSAAWYLIEHKLSEQTPCRFDVVGIDGTQVTLIKNAFDYCG